MGHRGWVFAVIISVMMALPAGAALVTLSNSSTAVNFASSGTSGGNVNISVQPDLSHVLGQVLSRNVNVSSGAASHSTFSQISHFVPAPILSPSSPSSKVTFDETGLPTNSTWYAEVSGIKYASNSSSATVLLANGSYSYNVGTSLSYVPLSVGGTLSVTGNPVSINVTFLSRLTVRNTLFLSNGTMLNGNFAQGISNSAPIGIVFDPANNYTYVVDSSSNQVDVINLAGTITSRVSVGSSPAMAAYDPINGYIYVTNSGSNSLSVLNSANNVVGTVDVGQFPFGISYNPLNHDMYVANLFSGNVSIIATGASPDIGSVVTSIQLVSGFLPFDSAYDNSTGSVFFTNLNGSNVASIKDAQLQSYLAVGGSPSMMAYDNSNGNMYVTDSQTSASTGYGYMSVIGPNGKIISNITIPGSANPIGIAYDPVRNLIYVTDSNNNILVSFDPVSNIFIDTVNVGSQPFGLVTGLSGNLVEVTDFGSGSVSFISYTGSVRSVTFGETGLFGSNKWSVTVNSVTRYTSGSRITFNEAPGNYNYSISPVSGYVLKNSSGSFSVSSANVSLPVNFMKLYSVSMVESGLPSGTSWGFILSGIYHNSTSRTISLYLANGTYSFSPYTVANAVSTGIINFTVSGGTESIAVGFNLTYSVSLLETGKMPGVRWSVSLGGIIFSANSSKIGAMVVNGTYRYVVEPINGYAIIPVNGTFTVNGTAVSLNISFTKLYSVTFRETGLYSNTEWSVTLNGSYQIGDKSTFSFNVSNGTYSYSAALPAYYQLSDGNGSVSVNGRNMTVDLTYTRLFNLTIEETGLASTSQWWIMLSGHNYTGTNGVFSVLLENGTYSYSAAMFNNYVVKDSSGAVTISGGNRTVIVQYDELFTITFMESGLPSGKSWTVLLNNTGKSTTGSAMSYSVVNGTYSFKISTGEGYASNVTDGSVRIAGQSRIVTLQFSKDIGNVTFNAVNLPHGANASLLFNGKYYNLSSGNITLTAFYENYSYMASYGLYNETFRLTGNITVDSGNLTVKLVFPVLYKITFIENGLNKDGNWGINFSGFNVTASGGMIVIYAANGTYNFTIYDSTGQSFFATLVGDMGFGGNYVVQAYSSMHAVGHNSTSDQAITVNGRNITVMINFNNAQHDKKDHKRHWYHDFRVIGKDVGDFAEYIVSIMQSAVTNVTSSLKLQYFVGSPIVYHPLFT